MLNKRVAKTALLWMPGHHGITGNEEADACAKQAAAITDAAPQPIPFAAASALIRRTLTDPPPCQCGIKEVYTKTFSWSADFWAASTWRDAVLFARAGHTLPLKAYANQLDTAVDPKCPSCGEELQTVEHWLH